MDDTRPADTGQDQTPHTTISNRRIANTTHVIYPEVDFVNRTDP